MSEEHFFSGYCRRIDGSRTVCAETENGALAEADCSYGSCPYEIECTIGKRLRELTQAAADAGMGI